MAAALREGRDGAAARAALEAPRAEQVPAGRDRPRREKKEEALEGLERWKARHPEVVPHLEPADVLIDSMRGRSTTWTRIRINLRHVPEADRPAQEPLEVDYDPWEGVSFDG